MDLTQNVLFFSKVIEQSPVYKVYHSQLSFPFKAVLLYCCDPHRPCCHDAITTCSMFVIYLTVTWVREAEFSIRTIIEFRNRCEFVLKYFRLSVFIEQFNFTCFIEHNFVFVVHFMAQVPRLV